jgi:hypothetical protein
LSLFPEEDIITKEIESWKGFADRLPDKDREIFTKILNDCYKYSKAINAKGRPFPTEPMIMALLLSQHGLIEWLEMHLSRNSNIRAKMGTAVSLQQ